jgi:hypothetical protein
LLFRSEGLQVGKVHDGHVQLAHVILGHDYGDTVEIVSGIDKSDAVIVNPSDSITQGQQVRIGQSNNEGE